MRPSGLALANVSGPVLLLTTITATTTATTAAAAVPTTILLLLPPPRPLPLPLPTATATATATTAAATATASTSITTLLHNILAPERLHLALLGPDAQVSCMGLMRMLGLSPKFYQPSLIFEVASPVPLSSALPQLATTHLTSRRIQAPLVTKTKRPFMSLRASLMKKASSTTGPMAEVKYLKCRSNSSFAFLGTNQSSHAPTPHENLPYAPPHLLCTVCCTREQHCESQSLFTYSATLRAHVRIDARMHRCKRHRKQVLHHITLLV